MGQTPESDDDFRKALRQPFARAEKKRDPGPSPIGDAKFESDERFGI